MNTLVIAGELWSIVKPVATVVITGYASLLAIRFNRLLGLKNENEMVDALHKAAENSLGYAAATLGTTVTEAVAGGAIDSVIETAKDYVKSKNPKTLKKLKVDDGALSDIIASKIGKAAVK